jgi:UBX domain-containing protein 1
VRKPNPSSDSGGIRTFADYSKDEEDRTNYYAGGEKSGLAIQDPNERKKNNNDTVSEVFKNAVKHGAVTPGEYVPPPEDRFQGSGFRLGNNPNENAYVIPSKPKVETRIKKILTFYKGGIFTIDDGPPRSFDDEDNRQFIEDINRGIVPYELERENPGKEVYVELIDKKSEDYKEQPKKIVAFSGSGNSLGGNITTTRTTNARNIAPRDIVFRSKHPNNKH